MQSPNQGDNGLTIPGRFIDYYDARLFVPQGHFDEANLLAGGKPESHVLGAFARFVGEGDIVVDVGANIGTHAFALASIVGPSGRVYAIEADVDNVGCLRSSILRSGSDNVFLLPVAAADKLGLINAQTEVSFNTQFSSRAKRTAHKVAGTMPLDAIVEGNVALIKIDIEGAELLALLGLKDTIERSRPVVLSEFSPAYITQALNEDRSREFFDFFKDRNYECFHLDHLGTLNHKLDFDELLACHTAAYEHFSYRHIDLIFVPAERKMPELRTAPPPKQTYAIPGFLLRRPASPDVPWRFEEPSLARTVSQLCTAEQMLAPEYARYCERLRVPSTSRQRKVWEFVYILASLEQRGKLGHGRRGLGFGTGHEPLPSCFAGLGTHVMASDAPRGLLAGEAWAQSQQWSETLDDLWLPDVLSREDFLERVEFRPVDMNAIPDDLRDFDFCWSACCLEHLGSIRHGLDFIRNSLATLKPGGVAVHTTEFNLGSEVDTLVIPELCLFRKSDIELVMQELIEDGHHVEPLNLWPGATALDEHIDLPPYSDVHLKIDIGSHVSTSIGIIVTKR